MPKIAEQVSRRAETKMQVLFCFFFKNSSGYQSRVKKKSDNFRGEEKKIIGRLVKENANKDNRYRNIVVVVVCYCLAAESCPTLLRPHRL